MDASNKISSENYEEEASSYEVSDESLERAANVERLGAQTISFCSGLNTCPA
jgi:hypothetical protein